MNDMVTTSHKHEGNIKMVKLCILHLNLEPLHLVLILELIHMLRLYHVTFMSVTFSTFKKIQTQETHF